MITAWQNRATNLTNGQASAIVRALQMQKEEFSQAWPALEDCTPLLFPPNAKLPEGVYPCVFVDTPDVAASLGYHSVDQGGKYFARIFVDLLLTEGAWNESVSKCASHEELELALNPTCLDGVPGPLRPEGSRYQKEACDPVEVDGYQKHVEQVTGSASVTVSNFVLPSYFDLATPSGARVDYLGTCPGPFQLAPNGYMLISKDGLEAPTSVFGERGPSASVLARKAYGRALAWREGGRAARR